MRQHTRHLEEADRNTDHQRLAFTAFLLTTCLCACHTTVPKTDSTQNPEKKGISSSPQPGRTTFHIEGTRVKSVDVYDLGSYTNTAFREADFPGGRIIE